MERLRSPAGMLALRRASRVAIVASVGFLLARFAFANAQMAVFAAFSAIALAAIPDLRGSRRGWVVVHAVAVLASAPLVALGTLVSADTVLASATMFVVVLVALLVAGGGGYFATLGNVLVMIYVVAASIPAPADSIAWRLFGLTTTGVLAVVAIWVFGPEPAEPRLRLAIAAVYRALAGLAGAPPEDVAARRAAVRRALDAVYPAVGSIADHPPGSDRVERSELHLLGRAFRIEAVLATLARPAGGAPDGRGEAPELLTAVRDALAACGTALASGVEPPDVRPVHEAWRAAREREATPPPTVAGASLARDLLLLGRLVTAATAEACVSLGATRAPGVAAALREATEPAAPGRRAPAIEWASRVRVQLTPRSQYLRNSFRLALGLTVARAIAGALGISHGFWVVFATLTVMRTTASRTGANIVQALAGTLAGAVVGSAVVLLVGREHVAYAILVPVLFFLAVYLGAVWNLVAGQAAFTVLVLVLFNLLTPVGWSLALTRLEDVAIGAAAGIAIGLLVWPRGAANQMRAACAEALTRSGRLAREDAAALHEGPARPDTTRAARSLLDAIHACDDVLARRLCERGDHVGVDGWVELLGISRMIWWAGQEIPEGDATGCEQVRVTAQEVAAATARRLEDLAAALRRHEPGATAGADVVPLLEAAAACPEGHALLLAVRVRNLSRDGDAAAQAVERLAGPPT